jgi:AraC-like DNA-binding protein
LLLDKFRRGTVAITYAAGINTAAIFHLCQSAGCFVDYLSEICKKVSGEPVTYWIDRFTLKEITRLLRQKELSLTTISGRLNFSSVSYFSRYVQKRLKITPLEYKNNF